MKNLSTILTIALALASSSAFAAETFTCYGKSMDESGALTKAQITLTIDGDSLTVSEDNGTSFGFGMQTQLDLNYRPSAKYAGYYRFNAISGNSSGWNDILIQKPMLDNKRAKAGGAVLQGTEEDGGMAAYFDYCSRVN
jgi:hypothetical protein